MTWSVMSYFDFEYRPLFLWLYVAMENRTWFHYLVSMIATDRNWGQFCKVIKLVDILDFVLES